MAAVFNVRFSLKDLVCLVFCEQFIYSINLGLLTTGLTGLLFLQFLQSRDVALNRLGSDAARPLLSALGFQSIWGHGLQVQLQNSPAAADLADLSDLKLSKFSRSPVQEPGQPGVLQKTVASELSLFMIQLQKGPNVACSNRPI